MHAFLCTDHKPLTIKAKGHLRYEEEILRAFKKYWPAVTLKKTHLYGIVYYFHKQRNNIDADNLCKPIFDALKKELYSDDGLVKLVRSGTFDLRVNRIDILDLSKMPDNVADDFLISLDNSDDILYIEIGDLDFDIVENIDNKKKRIAKLKGNKVIVKLNSVVLPETALRYIVAHELGHTASIRHTNKFWKTVQKMCPNFKRERKLIREFYEFL